MPTRHGVLSFSFAALHLQYISIVFTFGRDFPRSKLPNSHEKAQRALFSVGLFHATSFSSLWLFCIFNGEHLCIRTNIQSFGFFLEKVCPASLLNRFMLWWKIDQGKCLFFSKCTFVPFSPANCIIYLNSKESLILMW